MRSLYVQGRKALTCRLCRVNLKRGEATKSRESLQARKLETLESKVLNVSTDERCRLGKTNYLGIGNLTVSLHLNVFVCRPLCQHHCL